jgi:hypothetical protein
MNTNNGQDKNREEMIAGESGSMVNEPMNEGAGSVIIESPVTSAVDTHQSKSRSFPMFDVSISHTNAPRYFPDRAITPRSFMDNSGIAVRFEIADDHWIGVAAGHETLPLEIMRNGRDADIDGIDWFGVAYRLDMRSERMHMLYPVLRETLGLSTYGLVAKTGIGMRFSPNDLLHVGLGLEHTTIPLRTSEVMRGTGKLSLAYELSVQF